MLIIVMGLPGSGKSYFASRLSERLGATYVGSDRTRKSMQAMGHYSPGDKLLVYQQMAHLAGNVVKLRNTVVVDATFYRQVLRDIFIKLAKKHSVPACFIQIKAPEDLIAERLSRVREDSEAGYSVYQLLEQQFEEPEMPHLNLQSGRDNIEEMIKQALQYIKRYE